MRGFISTIEISSSHVSAVIGRIGSDDRFEILGRGQCAVRGGAGIFEDPETTAEAVVNAFDAAKQNARVDISEAYVCFTTEESTLMTATARRDFSEGERLVDESDAASMVACGYDYALPDEVTVIDVIPRLFYTDRETDARAFPWGMKTSYIEFNLGMAIVSKSVMRAVKKIMACTGIHAVGYSLSGCCVGYSVLRDDERADGAIVLNIGTSYTDISIFRDGTPEFCATIAMGSNDVTKDISAKLGISYNEADRIRRMYGLASTALVEDDHKVPVDVDGYTENVMLTNIVKVIEQRFTRIFKAAMAIVANENYGDKEPDTVVLTGIGSASAEGLYLLCESVTRKKKVRAGRILVECGGRIENVGAVGMAKYISENIQFGKQTLFAEYIPDDEKAARRDKKSITDKIIGIFRNKK